MLQGISAAGRQADSVLRLQFGRLSRTGAPAAQCHGAGATARQTRGPRLSAQAGRIRFQRPRARPMNELENQRTIEPGGLSPTAIKQCCAAVYESDVVKLLLGDSLHPGGVEMTERLGPLLGLGPPMRVPVGAAGPGTS